MKEDHGTPVCLSIAIKENYAYMESEEIKIVVKYGNNNNV
jgi:hypothetical protein